MDMTLPGLVSQQSILQGSAWLPVPDSRAWCGPLHYATAFSGGRESGNKGTQHE
jgi:hypothetical protein